MIQIPEKRARWGSKKLRAAQLEIDKPMDIKGGRDARGICDAAKRMGFIVKSRRLAATEDDWRLVRIK